MPGRWMRFLARERGLFLGAIIAAITAWSLGVPVDFVLFALTLFGVALAYVCGFLVMLAVAGWHPSDKRGGKIAIDFPPPAVKMLPSAS